MMLFAKELGISPPVAMAPHRNRRASARVAPVAGGSPLWLRTAPVSEGFCSHSHDSDMDLAMLVTEFHENGASAGRDSRASSDSDSGLPDLAHLADNITKYKQGGDDKENELLSTVHSLLISIHESELQHFKTAQCSGTCIRHLLVNLLRYSGYDAAVCTSKWQGFDKILGGDHEVIPQAWSV